MDAGAGSQLRAAGLSPARTSLRLFFLPQHPNHAKTPQRTQTPPQLSPTRGAPPAPGCVTSPAPAALFTLRWRPLKTTAKAPCPIRSFLLYSKSPTTSIIPQRGMKPPGRTEGKQRGSSCSYSRLTAAGGGEGACPGPGCPRRRGQLLSYRRRRPGRRGCCRASPRRGAPSGMGRRKGANLRGWV